MDGLFYGKYELIYMEVEPLLTLHSLCTCFCFRVRVTNAYLRDDADKTEMLVSQMLRIGQGIGCGNCSRSRSCQMAIRFDPIIPQTPLRLRVRAFLGSLLARMNHVGLTSTIVGVTFSSEGHLYHQDVSRTCVAESGTLPLTVRRR